MSLMNEALRNLDRSRKQNKINGKNTQGINNKSCREKSRLNSSQAAAEKLVPVWQVQNDALNGLFDGTFDDVNDHQGVFVFFRKYFFIGFCFLIFVYVGSVLMHKEKESVKPFLAFPFSYKTIFDGNTMRPFVQLNPLFNDFKNIHKNTASNIKINNSKVINDELVGKEESTERLAEKLTKNTRKIASLNDKGYAALASDFLSTPKKNNAMYFFQQVLAMDEHDVLALQGVNSVQRRYQKIIEINIERHNWKYVEKMLDRFLAVGGDEETVKNYKQLVVHHSTDETLIETVPSQSSSNNTDKLSYLSVEKSSYHIQKKIEQEAFFRSQQWLQKKQMQKAIDELNAVLNEQYYLTKPSAELLFDLYLLSENVEAARMVGRHVKNIKKTMLNNTSWDTAYEKARIEQAKNGDLAALTILHNIKAEWLGESSARLYAGLLQQNGDYDLAQNIYRNLLNIYHKNSTYWLGYGVSSDALGQLDNALTGYRKTQRLGGVSSDVQSYVAHRIRVLQSGANSLSQVMESSW